MFYEEMLIEGELHFRTKPNGAWFPKPPQQPDTITLPITEYEQLKKDIDRMNWLDQEIRLNGTVHFDRHGIEWTKLFSISTQKMKQQPTARAAIDQAMKDK
jgi:hypothetical protein